MFLCSSALSLCIRVCIYNLVQGWLVKPCLCGIKLCARSAGIKLQVNLVPLVCDVQGSVHGVAADLVLHGVLLVSQVHLPLLLLCPGGEHHSPAAAADWHGDA